MTTALHLWISALMLMPAAVTADQESSTAGGIRPLFVTADQCMACHNGLVTPSGEDVSIGVSWRASMMANSSRDPYWQAAVRREVMDHPSAKAAIENECAGCHMPMSRFEAKAAGRFGEIFAHLPVGAGLEHADLLAADGVSCSMCHQIQSAGFGSKESFTAGFAVDTTAAIGQRRLYGPFEVDQGRRRIMRSASGFQPEQGLHIQSSELCATCHTLFTHTLGPNGEAIGELPEQVPYLEWRHSDYRESQSCQSCHMPVVESDMPISGVLGEARSGFSRHVFRGGNFFMPRVFNRYGDQLGVTALSQEFDSGSRQTQAHLEADAARITIEHASASAGRLEVDVVLESLAGHKLPTAYPSRRAWVRISVRDAGGESLFESGAFQKDGSILGNDNDADASRYEPHYDEIDSSEKVQIYEAVMVDADDRVTTGLLRGIRFVKDNRLLPRGFDKSTAGDDIAVRGGAEGDGNFRDGGDRIRYSIALGGAKGPFSVQAELWYQPIAYRWAQNLRLLQAPETERFVGFYESMADGSAVILARAAARVPGR